jgi:sugar transferase EpsL
MVPSGRKTVALTIKRAMDVFLSILLLILLVPVYVPIALAILLTMGRPVLFRQMRPGLHGEPFEMLKFRTMSAERDGDGVLLPDAERLTRLGRLLRSLSLDELPELVNVARGEMSLVGPRPLLMQYLERYSPRQARRHEMRPGVTGPVTTGGRNLLSWDEKFELDVAYVDSWSLRLDMKILWRTVRAIVTREGISQPGHATAEEFHGSD